jgi:hypothetical protein
MCSILITLYRSLALVFYTGFLLYKDILDYCNKVVISSYL